MFKCLDCGGEAAPTAIDGNGNDILSLVGGTCDVCGEHKLGNWYDADFGFRGSNLRRAPQRKNKDVPVILDSKSIAKIAEDAISRYIGSINQPPKSMHHLNEAIQQELLSFTKEQ